MEMPKKALHEDKKKYEQMLSMLAAEHPELAEQADSLQEALFDLTAPDIAGQEEAPEEEMEMEDEMPEDGVEIEVVMPGKKPIPKELMDEEEAPKMMKKPYKK